MPKSESKKDKPRRRRGNGELSKARRKEKWVAKGGQQRLLEGIAEATEVKELNNCPGQLDHVPTKGKKFRQQVGKLSLEPTPSSGSSLTSAPADGIYFVTPSEQARKDMSPGHPGVFAIRCDNVITEDGQEAILRCWEEVKKSPIKWSQPHSNQSSTPGLHLNIWNMYSLIPHVTPNTLQQDAQAKVAIQKFLEAINVHVAPMINRLLKFYFPEVSARQQRARQKVSEDLIGTGDWIDFGGAFFTVAAKEGTASEIFHLDSSDDPDTITWTVPIGRWVGGDFSGPQLNTKIPVQSGQALGVTTRLLSDSPTLTNDGDYRLVLTLFSDKFLMKHADPTPQ
ncbi:hypothetical protein BDQ12DRAFT_634882 [Crucibulum laeve]|uniref:Uncharacterized protein n=1 Tax=Crucibulum laeve TaxID=68775 RepID=A0A5C3LRF9_9AGAR|nr:hypothetical protein BDQ12DRAFT_634882 [Crucibulum laeve]